MVTFSKDIKFRGSNQTTVNVSRNDRPFGQLWTFTAKGETHGWHAKTLAGDYRLFEAANKKDALFAARKWIAEKAAY
jgi:hypothetical protein